MSRKKSIHTKSYQHYTVLDNILWFIENYLPQKKKRSSHSEYGLENFESVTVNKIKKLAADRSKSMKRDFNNTKVTFTIGNWALPYLNFLKRIELLK